MKANSWASLYSGGRKAIDKAILQECERQIAAEEEAPKPIPGAGNPATHRSAMRNSIDNDARLAIAKAFGRPLGAASRWRRPGPRTAASPANLAAEAFLRW
jgi:hypothetical protein